MTSNGEWVELTFDRGLGSNFFFDLRKAAADKLVMYLDIEFIAGGFAPIEVNETIPVDLLDYTGFSASEIITATFNDLEISDVTSFDASDAGEVTLVVKKEGYGLTTFNIKVE